MSINIKTYGNLVDGIQEIYQSWYIILNTIKGSDPLRPNFGCSFFEYVDKPISSLDGAFISTIISELETYEKRATISKVEKIITSDGKISITISGYQISSGNKIDTTISLSDLKIINGIIQ